MQRTVLEEVEPVADGVVSLVLRGADGPLAPREPGAHVDLALPNWLVRQYSLCGDPADRDSYRVAGGIGITPIVPMLTAAVEAGASATLVYVAGRWPRCRSRANSLPHMEIGCASTPPRNTASPTSPRWPPR